MSLPSDCPKDLLNIFSLIFRLLRGANIRFFTENEPFLRRYWLFLYIVPSGLIFYISICAHMVEVLKSNSSDKFMELTSYIFVYTHVIFKAVILVLRSTDITAIMHELIKIWRHESELTAKQCTERSRILRRLNYGNKAIVTMILLTTCQQYIKPVITVTFNRVILGRDYAMWLTVPRTLPFNPFLNWPVFLGVNIFLTHISLVFVCIYIGSELLMISLCALLHAEFTILREDFARVKPKTDNFTDARGKYQSADKRSQITLEELVKRHQILLKLSNDLDVTFSSMNFCNLVFVTITTCLFVYAALFAANLSKMVLYYLGACFVLFYSLNLCYCSELLIHSSTRIAEVAYEHLWYKNSVSFQKNILFIIRRAQKPCCMNSLTSQMNLQTFALILKRTFSFMSLIRTLYDDQ